jgi:ABC-type long-subunit fatty acid transport system fused permease/ATPase subunit
MEWCRNFNVRPWLSKATQVAFVGILLFFATLLVSEIEKILSEDTIPPTEIVETATVPLQLSLGGWVYAWTAGIAIPGLLFIFANVTAARSFSALRRSKTVRG